MVRNRKDDLELIKVHADNVRSYRFQRNLSQEELADISGLHRTYIGSVERGERNVTLRTLAILADALNIQVIDLLIKKDQ
jgi:transcriptional regulator with XRE-family HTH domain